MEEGSEVEEADGLVEMGICTVWILVARELDRVVGVVESRSTAASRRALMCADSDDAL